MKQVIPKIANMFQTWYRLLYGNLGTCHCLLYRFKLTDALNLIEKSYVWFNLGLLYKELDGRSAAEAAECFQAAAFLKKLNLEKCKLLYSYKLFHLHWWNSRLESCRHGVHGNIIAKSQHRTRYTRCCRGECVHSHLARWLQQETSSSLGRGREHFSLHDWRRATGLCG